MINLRKERIATLIESQVSKSDGKAFDQTCAKLWHARMQMMPLTVDFNGLCTATNMRRSKAYEVLRDDATFPAGISLYDSKNSRKVWWTHQVIAWLMHRDPNNQIETEEI